MKVIPKRDLLWLIQTSKSADSVFLIEDVEELFETYGDDYYINRENGTYELCNQNEARKRGAMMKNTIKVKEAENGV